MFFSKKSLRNFSSTTFGVFHLECVPEFQIAEEFSKQSIFWVFRRNRCCFRKDPGFFKNRKTLHLSSSLRFTMYYCSRKLRTFKKVRNSGKKKGNFEKQPKLFQTRLFWQLFKKCVAKGFLHWNSQKYQTWVFVGKTGEFCWEKSLTFFQNPLFWQVCYRIGLKWCFYCRYLQKIRVWLPGKLYGFFRKVHGFFQKRKKSIYFIECVSNCITTKELAKRWKIGVFWKKSWAVREKMLSFSKTA